MGSRDSDRHLSKTLSGITLDHDRPVSFVSSYPQVSDDIRDRQRDLATEILGPNYHLVFPSPEGSQFDSQDVARLSDVSGLSDIELPECDRSKPLPSPPQPHLASSIPVDLKNSNKGSLITARESLIFTLRPSQGVSSSMKGVTSPRQSMFIENIGGIGMATANQAPSEAIQNAITITDWPLRTPTSSPGLDKPLKDLKTVSESKKPQNMVTVLSPQAKKGARLNFLPKFLRSRSPEAAVKTTAVDDERGKGVRHKKIETDASKQSTQEEGISPKSFFDDESSDEGESSRLKSAQQARIASPLMVQHSSGSQLGLKEMLRSTPPVKDTVIPLKGKDKKMVGEQRDSSDIGRDDIASYYEHHNAGNSKDGSLRAGLLKEINPFKGQKSERSTQGLTPVPTPSPAPKPSRKVSFTAPPPLDIHPEHRFLRQSIVSTPYPPNDPKEGPVESQGNAVPEPILILIIYGNGNSTPRMKKIVIPNPRNSASIIHDEKAPPAKAMTMNTFDNETLFKLIRKEYANMRGTLRQCASARTVRGIKLLSYQTPSQLMAKHGKPTHFQVDEEDGISAEARILSLFRKPKLGRGHQEWTQWIRSQRDNVDETSSSIPGRDKIAFELVEGWSPVRIYLVVATVMVSSLLTTLLWILLGSGKGGLALANAFGGTLAPLKEDGVDYRGSGQRVGSGALLGLLVLFLGWTGVVGWVALSWLVM